MKITDLKCAIIGDNPIVRIKTDAGIDGWGQAEWTKPYLKPFVLYYKDAILEQDPTDVERVVSRIRRLGSFKPWGAAVSAIEVALWDIAGKAAGVPVYKLLGGKVRDKVRVYNGGIRVPLKGNDPEHFAENMAEMKEFKEGFSIIKQGISFHSQMAAEVPNYFYGELPKYSGPPARRGATSSRGPIDRTRPETHDCVRRSHERRARRRGRSRPRLRPWNDRSGHATARQSARTTQHHVARRHHHRRLHSLRSPRTLPRGNHTDLHTYPYRRADLPPPELQRPHRI